MDYRTRLYEKYATNVQGAQRPVSPEEAIAWARVYGHYLQGWLPPYKDAAIVDLACGSGKLLHYFASLGYTNVLGVDISPEQVAHARHLHPNVEQANIVEFLQSRRGEFDLITGIDIIEHLTRDEILTFLDGCLSALRPGGRLVLQTLNGESVFRGENWHGDLTHETCLSPKSLAQAMRVCGFEQFEAREQGPIPHGFKSSVRAAMWRVIRLQIALVNLVETGSPGSGVYSRVFIASGVKPR